MRIRIIDCDTHESWLYNVSWDVVKKNLSSYERLHIMDDELLDDLAIDMAVKQFFGEECNFLRDTNIRSYIYGNIKKKRRNIRPVYIFFES